MPTQKMITWVVLMDSKQARIFCKDESHHLRDLNQTLIAEPVRTDTPTSRRELGRSYDSAGSGRHIIEPHTSDLTLARINFTHIIASFLDDSLKKDDYHRLILIAPAKMLGILRKQLSESVLNVVVHELDKNFIQLTAGEVQEHLEEIVPI